MNYDFALLIIDADLASIATAKKIGIVEVDRLGGTRVNRSCVE